MCTKLSYLIFCVLLSHIVKKFSLLHFLTLFRTAPNSSQRPCFLHPFLPKFIPEASVLFFSLESAPPLIHSLVHQFLLGTREAFRSFFTQNYSLCSTPSPVMQCKHYLIITPGEKISVRVVIPMRLTKFSCMVLYHRDQLKEYYSDYFSLTSDWMK